jgi:hypothetical protein
VEPWRPARRKKPFEQQRNKVTKADQLNFVPPLLGCLIPFGKFPAARSLPTGKASGRTLQMPKDGVLADYSLIRVYSCPLVVKIKI